MLESHQQWFRYTTRIHPSTKSEQFLDTVNFGFVRSCSGVVSLKNGSLMTAIKILLYTVYTVMLTDDDDDDDEL